MKRTILYFSLVLGGCLPVGAVPDAPDTGGGTPARSCADAGRSVPAGPSPYSCNPTWASFCELGGTGRIAPTGGGCYVCAEAGGERAGRATQGLCCGPAYPAGGEVW